MAYQQGCMNGSTGIEFLLPVPNREKIWHCSVKLSTSVGQNWDQPLDFLDHCPCDMEQFPCGGIPHDFLWLPCGTQPSVERCNHGVMLGGTQGRHVECSPYTQTASACP